MKIYLLISFAVAIGWLIKDWIETKKFPISTSWNKYVGCIVAGVLYTFLKGVTFFQWFFEVGVIVLVAYCWQTVWTFVIFVYNAIKNALTKK